jgi:hypothetical protein
LFKGSTTRKIVESAAIPVFGFHGSWNFKLTDF